MAFFVNGNQDVLQDVLAIFVTPTTAGLDDTPQHRCDLFQERDIGVAVSIIRLPQ
jgi:hypothetical protein